MIKRLKGYLFFTLYFAFSMSSFAQNNSVPPCSSLEARQFDFWIGNWKAEWANHDSTLAQGSNIVKVLLNGCAIEENFNGNPGLPFEGKSFSVFDQQSGKWKQTWVDNSGNYMLFEGGKHDGKMILSREIQKDGIQILQRMVFYNIEEDTYMWNWEQSQDNSKTWQLMWKINYERIN